MRLQPRWDAIFGAVADDVFASRRPPITRMQVIDSNAVDNFLRMARSVGLLGAQCMLTGIDPKLAQTMVSLGVDLSSIITFRTLRAALDRIAGVPDHGSA